MSIPFVTKMDRQIIYIQYKPWQAYSIVSLKNILRDCPNSIHSITVLFKESPLILIFHPKIETKNNNKTINNFFLACLIQKFEICVRININSPFLIN